MPAPGSAGRVARRGIGGGDEASGGEQENRRLGLHAEPLDEMEQQASETRVRMLRCTDRRHEGFWTPKFSAPARPVMKVAGWREHRHGIRGGKME
jgi:hypothetical protein